MGNWIAAAALITLTGCSTTPSREASKITETDENGIASCKFLSSVEGSSSYGGFAAQEVGLKRAKNEALDKAGAIGATHIVWLTNSKGFLGGNASGRAYKCDK